MILDMWQHLSNAEWALVGLCLVGLMGLAYGWLVEGF